MGYLGGAEDYHWGNEPYMTQAHCAATGFTCQKDMWCAHTDATLYPLNVCLCLLFGYVCLLASASASPALLSLACFCL